VEEKASILPSRHSVSTLLICSVIQDPEDLAWKLYLKDIITADERRRMVTVGASWPLVFCERDERGKCEEFGVTAASY